MKARPIIFSPSNAAKVADESKIMTRRILKPQPEHLQIHEYGGKVLYDGEHRMWCWKDLVLENIWDFPDNDDRKMLAARCPYGKPGDFLWVRESWIEGFATGERNRWSCLRPTGFDGHGKVFYRAENEDPADGPQLSWRNAMFMPRWASRTTLEIVGVRVERLGDISKQDALAEGISVLPLQDANDPSALFYLENGLAEVPEVGAE